MMYGVDLALEKGWQQVTFEGDNLSVINELQSHSPCLPMAGHYIDSIKTKVGSCFFFHVLRSANCLAHDIAQRVDSDSEGVLFYLSENLS